jgi:hypothetical protein
MLCAGLRRGLVSKAWRKTLEKLRGFPAQMDLGGSYHGGSWASICGVDRAVEIAFWSELWYLARTCEPSSSTCYVWVGLLECTIFTSMRELDIASLLLLRSFCRCTVSNSQIVEKTGRAKVIRKVSY